MPTENGDALKMPIPYQTCISSQSTHWQMLSPTKETRRTGGVRRLVSPFNSIYLPVCCP